MLMIQEETEIARLLLYRDQRWAAARPSVCPFIIDCAAPPPPSC